MPLGYFKTRESNVYLDTIIVKKIPTEPIPKDPRPNCRIFVSGALISDRNHGYPGYREIYVEDAYSEYVGAGEYPDNVKAFPKSAQSTFDGIAIDKGTRVIIYSEKNFKGDVLLDKNGPAIINNMIWKDSLSIDWKNIKFKPPYQDTFPSSKRYFSKSNMNKWSYGSMKVICNSANTPAPCNTKGDSGTNTDSTLEYDLGKENGIFNFRYETYSVPDMINIYNCKSSEIENNTPIFSINESTASQKNINIRFTKPIITVEVIAGGNNKRYTQWKYFVECPK